MTRTAARSARRTHGYAVDIAGRRAAVLAVVYIDAVDTSWGQHRHYEVARLLWAPRGSAAWLALHALAAIRVV